MNRHLPRNVSLLLFLLVAVSNCSGTKFTVFVEPSKVTVDCQRLGEYPSAINRILLSERFGGKVVWDAQAASGSPQVHFIIVRTGNNSRTLEGITAGTIEVRVPSQGDFTLLPGVEYNLAVWGKRSEKKAADVNFALK